MIGVMIASFVVFAVFSMPVAVALGLATVVAVYFFSDYSLLTVAQRMISGVDSYTLLAIPLFILTGRLMNEGGITDRIFDFSRKCVGHIRGGLGHVNVMASMIFAGMSGSAVADAGGLGQVELKVMNDQGYPREFSAAITAVSSCIGPIIPPSIPFVMYAAIAEVSPGRLLLSGLLPGLLMGLSLMVAIYIMSFFKQFPQQEKKAAIRERWLSFRSALLPLLTPVIIMGGIMGGIFTPTEASAVAAIYSAVLGIFVYKSIKLKNIPDILIETVITTAIVVFIMACSSSFSWLLIMKKVANALSVFVMSVTSSKFLIMLILNLVMLALGCFMEAGVLITLLTPLFLPIAKLLNIDLYQFGVIMVMNLMIGVATPPVGMSLYVVSKLGDVSIEKMAKPVFILLIPLVVTLLLVTYFPGFSTALPNLLLR